MNDLDEAVKFFEQIGRDDLKETSYIGLLTNKVLDLLITITAWVVVPLQIVTTFVLGILVMLTFGFLLLPLSLVWIVLFFVPLLSLSYVWEHLAPARPFISILGVPLALIANTYVALVPSMGEIESRIVKLLYCQTFPYTWRFHRFLKRDLDIDLDNDLRMVFRRVSKDTAIRQYLMALAENKR